MKGVTNMAYIVWHHKENKMSVQNNRSRSASANAFSCINCELPSYPSGGCFTEFALYQVLHDNLATDI